LQRRTEKREEAAMLKLMTLNLNLYDEKHGAWPRRRRLIFQGVRDAAIDLLAMQAVRRHRSVERGLDQGAQLAGDLEGFSHRVFRPAAQKPDGSEDGLGILSKLRLGDVTQLPLSFVPDSQDPSERTVIRTTVGTEVGDIGIINAHLSWVPAQHERNVQELLAFIEDNPGPQVLLGDFNAAPDAPGMRQLKERGLVDAWAHLRPQEPGPTFESHRPERRLDYVWVTRDLVNRLEDVERVCQEGEGGVRASDHYGVAVTMRL
jgi:endonuclease/exonuclease/phosphatase family metal-dependent hydrolase